MCWVSSRALGRAVRSYTDGMTELRFPTHVLGNVPGTQLQEHGWEIAGASNPERVLEIWLRECARGRAPLRQPKFERFGCVNVPGPGPGAVTTNTFSWCVRVRVLSCADVSSESGRMASPPLRCLAVWPLESGRVASGHSPHGVASCLHARLGYRRTWVEWSAILPSPGPHTCS